MEKKDKQLNFQTFMYWFLVAFGIVAITIMFIMLGMENASGKVEIVDRDGIAYIQYLDKTCKLLDENGSQLPFTSTIKSEHPLSICSNTIGNSKVTIIYDSSTQKYYISMKDEQNEDVVQAISIMYNAEEIQ